MQRTNAFSWPSPRFFRYATLKAAAFAALPLLEQAQRESEKHNPDPKAAALLKAAKRYDLRKVLELLELGAAAHE